MDNAILDRIMRTPCTTQTIISNVYRLAAWVYLRWTPIFPLHLVLPALFLIYLPVWAIEKVPEGEPAPIEIVEHTEKPDGATANGFTIRRQGPNPTAAPIRLLLSLPSRSIVLRWLNLLINTAILAMAADFTLRQYTYTHEDLTFARLGATTSDSVKVHIRYPGLEADGGALKLLWREMPRPEFAGSWKDGPILHLSADKDWTGVAEIKKLWPATEYEYRLAYPNSTFLDYPSSPLTFKTFPDQRLTGGTHFSFIASSGIIPNFPYRPSKETNRVVGFDLLADQLFPPSPPPTFLEKLFFKTAEIPSTETASPVTAPEPEVPAEPVPVGNAQQVLKPTLAPEPVPEENVESTETSQVPVVPSATKTHVPHTVATPPTGEKTLAPSFVLLIGDLVNYELPYPMKPFESLHTLYRRIYASPSFRKIYERIPIFNILHKGGSNLTESAEAYSLYSGQANFNASATTLDAWYDFRYGDVAFFVLDTHTHRSLASDLEEADRTLLGDKQLGVFMEWAGKVNHTATFKFVISPTPLSSMWGSDHKNETWSSFKSERTRIVDMLKYIPNVVVISGDRNEFATIHHQQHEGGFWEVVTGPMSSHATPSWFTKLHSLKAGVKHGLVRQNMTRTKTFIVSSTETLENGTVVPIEVETPLLGEDGMPIEETVEIETMGHQREERIVASYHEGNYKWSRFEVDTTDAEKPTVKVELSIDGHRVWSMTIQGRPVHLVTTSAIGMTLTGGIKGMLERVGLNKLFRTRPY